MARTLVVGLVAVAAMAWGSAVAEYEMEWRSSARVARGNEDVSVPVAEIAGRAVARLLPVAPGVLRLEWSGAEGAGHGLVGPAGPVAFEFPSPLT